MKKILFMFIYSATIKKASVSHLGLKTHTKKNKNNFLLKLAVRLFFKSADNLIN